MGRWRDAQVWDVGRLLGKEQRGLLLPSCHESRLRLLHVAVEDGSHHECTMATFEASYDARICTCGSRMLCVTQDLHIASVRCVEMACGGNSECLSPHSPGEFEPMDSYFTDARLQIKISASYRISGPCYICQ